MAARARSPKNGGTKIQAEGQQISFLESLGNSEAPATENISSAAEKTPDVENTEKAASEKTPAEKTTTRATAASDKAAMREKARLAAAAKVLEAALIETDFVAAESMELVEIIPLERGVPVEPKIWSVTELSKSLRDNLREHYPQVLIRGEICDFKGIHRSGHCYMALKDENSQIRVVVWKGVVQKIPFDLKMGLDVVITGTIDYYGAGGSLQIVADRIDPLGMGALQMRFEQLKEKLLKEGLFSEERKKEIPEHVERIALVTGKSTAALQDMLRIFSSVIHSPKFFCFTHPCRVTMPRAK